MAGVGAGHGGEWLEGLGGRLRLGVNNDKQFLFLS